MYTAIINGKSYEVDIRDDKFFLNGKPYPVDIAEYRDLKFHVLQGSNSMKAEIVEVIPEEKKVIVRVNNNLYPVTLRDQYDVLLEQMGLDAGAGKKVNDIKAPMPGLVLHVMVETGQEIKKGDAIVVLEAMKMENILKSPSDGVIRKVHVVKGDKVEKNQVMVNMG